MCCSENQYIALRETAHCVDSPHGSSADGCLVRVHFWNTVNNAAVNTGEQVFVWMHVFVSLVYMPRVEVLGPVGTPCLQ